MSGEEASGIFLHLCHPKNRKEGTAGDRSIQPLNQHRLPESIGKLSSLRSLQESLGVLFDEAFDVIIDGGFRRAGIALRQHRQDNPAAYDASKDDA